MQPNYQPDPLPRPAPPRPVEVPPAAPRRRAPKTLIFLVLLGVVGLGLYLGRQQLLPPATGGGGPVEVLRTAVVKEAPLEQAIRLTGVTVPEQYSTLVAPQLRGGRGGSVSVNVSRGAGGMQVTIAATSGMGGGGGDRGGGGGRGGGDRGGGDRGGGDRGGGGGGGGGSAASSGAGGGASVAASMPQTSAGGGASSTSSSFRSSSNRFGSSSASTASRASTPSASSSGGSGGGGGGGGEGPPMMSGGASDFMSVLQSVAKPGTIVKKGDVVAEFDKQYQQTRLDDYGATVRNSELGLKISDSNIELQLKAHQQSIADAKAAVEKAKLDIKTTPVLSQIQTELLQLQLEEAEARLKQLQSEVPFYDASFKAQRRSSELELGQTRIEHKRAEQNVERLSVTAPRDGMVVMQNTLRGSEFGQIQQGDQLFPGQSFMQIVDPSSMLVQASVNQTDVESIRVGARARLQFDAFPGLVLPAKVISIAAITKPGGQRGSFVKEVPVFLRIERMDSRVIPDLSVSVDVILDEHAQGVVAPLESVFKDSAEGKPYVWVKSREGFEKRFVELGARNNVHTSVLNGLKPGEAVALEPPKAKPAEQQKIAGDQNVKGS
jgi:multidrug resistance efflux pump